MAETKKILIIDDEELFCELLVNKLRFEGFYVTGFATNHENGLVKLENDTPEIVILNININNVLQHNIDYIKAILKRDSDISIIALHNTKICDASQTMDVVDRVMIAGCKGFVIKQDCFEDLKRAILKISDSKLFITSSLQDELTERFFTSRDSEVTDELYTLRENMVKYRNIFSDANIILYKIDQKGVITDISQSVTNITGFEMDEVIGKPYSQFIHSDDLEDIMGRFRYQQDLASDMTEVRISSNEKNTLFMITAYSMLDNDTVAGVLIDNTEQKTMREELINSEKRFKSMIEYSSDVIQVTDIKGQITYISPSIENNFGYQEKDILGRNMLDNIYFNDHEVILNSIQKIVGNNGKKITAIYQYQHADGSWKTVESVITNCLDDSSINGIMNNFRDITDRKITEKKLLDVMLQQLTAREQECLSYYKEGYDKRDISLKMDVERETVDKYMKRILEKMGRESIEDLLKIIFEPTVSSAKGKK